MSSKDADKFMEKIKKLVADDDLIVDCTIAKVNSNKASDRYELNLELKDKHEKESKKVMKLEINEQGKIISFK